MRIVLEFPQQSMIARPGINPVQQPADKPKTAKL